MDADIIFMNSTVFPIELVDEIMKMCSGLKNGTRIISTKAISAQPYLEERARFKIKMSWSIIIAILYIKI